MDSIMVPPGIIILGYVWRHARYSLLAPLTLSAISFLSFISSLALMRDVWLQNLSSHPPYTRCIFEFVNL